MAGAERDRRHLNQPIYNVLLQSTRARTAVRTSDRDYRTNELPIKQHRHEQPYEVGVLAVESQLEFFCPLL